MDIIIVTGASRGIGFELVKQLRSTGNRVFGIARTAMDDVDYIQADLADTAKLEEVISNIIEETRTIASSYTLINNAGIVDPIGIMGTVSNEMTTTAIAVNVTAPIVLSNVFIEQLQQFAGPKKIMNISSGAGRKEYEGWGVYCTTKAALDQFTKVVALEQKSATNPVEIVAIAPGIIDTSMQEVIRSSDEEKFPLLEQFIQYKEQDLLSSAEQTAQKLIRFLSSEDFTTGDRLADIRNY